jgi:hypothetical protein
MLAPKTPRRGKEMDKFMVGAVFRQFPWLADIPKGSWGGEPDEWCAENDCTESGWHTHPTFLRAAAVEEALVSRIDRDFLSRVPMLYGARGCAVGIADSLRIHLLDKDGNILTEVRQGEKVLDHEGGTHHYEVEGETVGVALLRLEDPDAVVHAVSVHTGYVVEDHHSVGGFRVVVHKPPQGFTLKGWVDEQTRRADALVAASIAEIDAEGEPTAEPQEVK